MKVSIDCFLWKKVTNNSLCVIPAGPTCSPEPGVKEVEAGVIVLMTCEAEFYGYREPDLQWSSELGSHLGTVTVIDNKVTYVKIHL